MAHDTDPAMLCTPNPLLGLDLVGMTRAHDTDPAMLCTPNPLLGLDLVGMMRAHDVIMYLGPLISVHRSDWCV